MRKRLIAFTLMFMFCAQSVSASILGTVLMDTNKITMGEGVVLKYNKIMSDQSGVGNQTEYYAEYTPNEKVTPVVLTGDSVNKRFDTKEAIEYMKNNDMKPMIGINASYFSYQTGIPMGHVITDGVIMTKESRSLPAVGFRKDNSAFIDDLKITVTATSGSDTIDIPSVNKYILAEIPNLTLFTPDYANKTGTSTQTLNVELTDLSGKLSIGQTVNCTVGEKYISDNPVEINEGKYILSVNTKGNEKALAFLNSLEKGQDLQLDISANSDKWTDVWGAIASEGARLLKDSNVGENLEKGAAPRTAVGIKENGNVIFYVIDGRQTGYSYGVKQETLALRLKELGCVDAINLDGGGSTSIAGIYPGCEETTVMNRPSDGNLRKVTNFIFLKNTQKPTGIPKYAYIYPYKATILSGSTMKVDVKTVDENYYETDFDEVSFTANEYATVTDDGVVRALGHGRIKIDVNASGATGQVEYNSLITPDKIEVYNKKTNEKISKLDVKPGDKISLYAKAIHNNEEMISTNEAYRWTLSDDENAKIVNGELEIYDSFVGSVNLLVKAGEKEIIIPVKTDVVVNDEMKYPQSTIEIGDREIIVQIKANTSYVDKEASYIKIDGKKVSFSDSEKISDKHIKMSIKIDDDFKKDDHKITCVAVLNDANTSITTKAHKAGNGINPFVDVNEHWAKDTICYMNKMRVINGQQSEMGLIYRPDDNVSRAEFATMVVNMLGVNSKDYESVELDEFVDVDKIPLWAVNNIKAAYKIGVITGKKASDGVYVAANDSITRAEAITMISRILPRNLRVGEISFNDKEEIPQWALTPVKLLVTSGLINGYSDNTIKTQKNVTRAEAITMLYNIY